MVPAPALRAWLLPPAAAAPEAVAAAAAGGGGAAGGGDIGDHPAAAAGAGGGGRRRGRGGQHDLLDRVLEALVLEHRLLGALVGGVVHVEAPFGASHCGHLKSSGKNLPSRPAGKSVYEHVEHGTRGARLPYLRRHRAGRGRLAVTPPSLADDLEDDEEQDDPAPLNELSCRG